jgi:hypothetical protein
LDIYLVGSTYELFRYYYALPWPTHLRAPKKRQNRPFLVSAMSTADIVVSTMDAEKK